eukprot:1142362-Pelagomonas_calceolata.AAC.14
MMRGQATATPGLVRTLILFEQYGHQNKMQTKGEDHHRCPWKCDCTTSAVTLDPSQIQHDRSCTKSAEQKAPKRQMILLVQWQRSGSKADKS